MTVASSVHEPGEPLLVLRHLRATQAWTLLFVAVASMAGGVMLLLVQGGDARAAVQHAIGWQFLIWGAIDLGFAMAGILHSAATAKVPVCPQAEADEFLEAEKLLKTLRFNQKLNVGYVLIAALLLSAAAGAQSATLLGHGLGVLIQGGFLLVFDWVYVRRYARLMQLPLA